MRRVLSGLASFVAAVAWAGRAPVVGPAAPFASGLNGPEGIATGSDGALIVGSVTGEVRKYRADGTFTVVANVGDRLAGISPARAHTVLACAFDANRVWSIDVKSGTATVVASGIDGANFAVEARKRRRYVSASRAGTIVDIGGGTPVVLADGLQFPNGLAIGRDRYLYVAESAAGQVSRLRILSDGSLGPPAVYASGLPVADGLAFDADGNLLVLASGRLYVVLAKTGAVQPAVDDPLYDGPANLVFGRGHGLRRRDLFLTNFGRAFGDGTSLIRVPYSRPGAAPLR